MVDSQRYGESYGDFVTRRNANLAGFFDEQRRQRESEYRPQDYGPGKCSL